MKVHIIRASVLFVLMLASAGISPSTQPQSDPQDSAELAKAKLKAAQEVYSHILEGEKKATRKLDPESRYVWSSRILKAECEVAGEKSKGYIAAFKAHFERMVELEQQTRDWAKAKQIGIEQVSAAEFFRVEAEWRWAQAKKQK